MFYFLLNILLSYNWLLIAAAVIPAVILMIKVYVSDRVEKESTGLLLRLIKAGVLSSLLALVEEKIGHFILGVFLPEGSLMFEIFMYFGVVALSEESSKYLFMKRDTWHSSEFNCFYDGAVYALFTSLGFALWENISYVLSFGFSTALVRAVTAIPGHASFGVFMGVFYGAAKGAERRGDLRKSKICKATAVLLPAFMHGAYDFIAAGAGTTFPFIIYVVILFAAAYMTVAKAAKKDQYFGS